MQQFVGFNNLQVGQRIKVKGKPGDNGSFTALDISVKPSKYDTAFEGVVQSNDPEKRVIRIFGRDYAIPAEAVVKNVQRDEVGLEAVKVGDLVKLKGSYSPSTGFVPEKVKVQESKSFNIEEVQGIINGIDKEKKSLEVAGITVIVNEKTGIEGF